MDTRIIEDYYIYKGGRLFKRANGRLISEHKCKNGYHRCWLTINGKRKAYSVHRLVALKYIPNPENKTDVNHIDGDKSNNDISNLEWMTRKENMNHARDVLGRKMGCIEDELRNEMIKFLRTKYKRDDVARLLGVTPENITARCK